MKTFLDLDKKLDRLVDSSDSTIVCPTFRQCFLSVLGGGKAASADEARIAARMIVKLRAGMDDLQFAEDEIQTLKKRVEQNTSAFVTWTHGQLLLYLDAY